MFAKSLVSQADYLASLEAVGFEILDARDMTPDWTDFTTQRLALFDRRQDAFTATHSPALFAARRHFYAKIVEYFRASAIGGIQIAARRPKAD